MNDTKDIQGTSPSEHTNNVDQNNFNLSENYWGPKTVDILLKANVITQARICDIKRNEFIFDVKYMFRKTENIIQVAFIHQG